MREALRQARTAVTTIGVSALLAFYVGSTVRLEHAVQIAPALSARAVGAREFPPGQFLGRGEASHYGMEFSGRPTASGELYRPGLRTAAHPSLPLGSRVRVTNLENGRTTEVRINDRGPFSGDRVIDLSHSAAGDLGLLRSGSAPVELQLVEPAR